MAFFAVDSMEQIQSFCNSQADVPVKALREGAAKLEIRTITGA